MNPREFSPFLHVGPNREYVPRWSGMRIELGEYDRVSAGSRLVYVADTSIDIQLLPPISAIPAPEFSTQHRIALVINSLFDEKIFPFLQDEHTIIACSHGTNWGLEPEKMLVENLQRRGRTVATYGGSPVFPKIGGRNRIQTHGILLTC